MVHVRGETPRGFLSVKRKLRRLSSVLNILLDSHFTGVKPPRTLPFLSDMKARVFARPSQRWWNS
jgi:hypothetical protein